MFFINCPVTHMESTENQIMGWLTAAFTQSPKRYSEMFYFDKSYAHFFSILVTDYFFFDDDFEIAEDVSSSYELDTIILIGEKVKRIYADDPLILSLPRLGNQLDDLELLRQIETYLNLNAINLDNTTLWLPKNSSGAITIAVDCLPTPKSPPLPSKAGSLFGRIQSFFLRRYRLRR